MMAEAFQLGGKVALVTGGASGIGAATCRELASAGARVYIADLNLAAAEALAAELGGSSAIHLDVTEPSSIDRAVKSLPHLDILVNNAGIGHVGTIEEVGLEDFDRLMKVNVYSIYLVTQALLPLLLESHGSIVNIGSVAGQV
jgi:NAD(P)-dependent dehydrogenase (short-subunit alcohol dehydrogenase family)